MPPEFYEAEFLVPALRFAPGAGGVAEDGATAGDPGELSGVEWLLPHVPAGVTVCNAKGTRDVVVSEWVLAAILAMTKDLAHWHRQQEEGAWKPILLNELPARGFSSSAMARSVAPSRPASRRSTCPSSAWQADRAMLERMKPGALLVNAGRGAAVDTGALVDAVGAGRIRAALDVTDPEPLPEDHPLWRLPGVLLTPHLAGDSEVAERRVYRLIGEQVARYLRGEPLVNVVTA